MHLRWHEALSKPLKNVCLSFIIILIILLLFMMQGKEQRLDLDNENPNLSSTTFLPCDLGQINHSQPQFSNL